MAKKKFKRNIYLGGGGLASLANTQGWNQIPASAGPQKTPLNIGGALGGALGGLSGGLGGIANGVATGLSNLMNPSGNSTGVGNALQTVGSIASNIPGVGGLVGAAVNLVGGAVNAAFGSNINEEFVDQTKQGAAQQASYVSNATDNSSLLSDWGSHQDMAHVSQDDVGTDGWFSTKAKNLTKKLNRKIDQANFRAWSSLANTASNIDSKNDMNVMANFSANGGPLFSTGAIGYELASRDLNNKQMKALGDMKLTSLPNSFNALPDVSTINTFAKGGGIHIKKKNRGKFTDYCGGKVTSECIARGKRSSSPTIRKRATFAANARKWHHAFGGDLLTHGGIWSNGMTYIDNGGTHEENPFEGVQMGIDPQGIPNLVEEGEVVYNNYVFSNRLEVPEDLKKKYRIRGKTYADAAKYMSKESEERPNDPISKNGLSASMSILANSQENMRNRDNNKYSHGGKLGNLFDGLGDGSQRLKTYSNYTKLADDSFYTPEYMNFWNWYKANNNTETGKKWLQRINSGEFGDIGGNTFNSADISRLAHDYKRGPVHNAFAEAAKQFSKENRTINPFAPLKINDNPDIESLRGLSIDSPIIDAANTLSVIEDAPFNPKNKKNKGNISTWLRYAPVLGSAIGLGYGLFSKPDYTPADAILEASKDAGNYMPIQANPIGNYLAYRPFDRMFYINQLNANNAAGRRAIQNTSGGNRAAAMAGILASDYNYGNSLGNLARQAEEYNLAQRERVEGFNRQTNMFNSEQDLKAQAANQSALAKSKASRLSGVAQAMAMRDAIDAKRGASMSANLTNLFDSLGNIGIDAMNRADRDMLIEAGVFGTLSEKPQEWSDKRWEDYKKAISGEGYSRGGKLKKRRGGLTY